MRVNTLHSYIPSAYSNQNKIVHDLLLGRTFHEERLCVVAVSVVAGVGLDVLHHRRRLLGGHGSAVLGRRGLVLGRRGLVLRDAVVGRRRL